MWQRRAGDSWKTYFQAKIKLKTDSGIDVYMTSGVVKRVRYRVRIVFLPDADHVRSAAAWSYFKAV